MLLPDFAFVLPPFWQFSEGETHLSAQKASSQQVKLSSFDLFLALIRLSEIYSLLL